MRFYNIIGCGINGGVAAFLAMQANYGIALAMVFVGIVVAGNTMIGWRS